MLLSRLSGGADIKGNPIMKLRSTGVSVYVPFSLKRDDEFWDNNNN